MTKRSVGFLEVKCHGQRDQYAALDFEPGLVEALTHYSIFKEHRDRTAFPPLCSKEGISKYANRI